MSDETKNPSPTLRDLFAMHAPPAPTDWNSDAEKVEYRPPAHGFTGDKFEKWKGHGDYIDDRDIPPEWITEFRDFKRRRDEYATAYNLLVARAKARRDAEWRYFHADAMMVAARPSPASCPVCGGTEHVEPIPGTHGRMCVKCCGVADVDRPASLRQLIRALL